MPPAIGILGAGSFGLALATWLTRVRGATVTLWGHDPEHVRRLRETRSGAPYLPPLELPPEVLVTDDLRTLAGLNPWLFVVPSRALATVAARVARALSPAPDTVLLSGTKGIDHASGRRMSEVLDACFPGQPIAVLSGPGHAEELVVGTPTALVLGCSHPETAAALQHIFNAGNLRVYTSDDLTGIELGGALKNVFALAAGMSDGLELGDNAKAALVTRALAEMIRLGSRLGGRTETFYGLSGIGDLMVTCFSRHSRNRAVGERLGRGESLTAVLASMRMVAEGVPTAESAFRQARRLGVSTPITDQVHAVLNQQQSPRQALQELLCRLPRPEPEPGVVRPTATAL